MADGVAGVFDAACGGLSKTAIKELIPKAMKNRMAILHRNFIWRISFSQNGLFSGWAFAAVSIRPRRFFTPRPRRKVVRTGMPRSIRNIVARKHGTAKTIRAMAVAIKMTI